jgi:dihydrofolate reductase
VGKIIFSTNMSLDGVVQDPDGKEGTAAGGWFDQAMDDDRGPWSRILIDEATAADALLLGRRSDSWFAARWLSRTGEFADRLNSMPKYVVSATAETAEWSNATVLRDAEQVAAVKRDVAGEILLYASYRLGHELLARDLVDELRLFVLPIVAGTGERLFGTDGSRKAWRLTGVRAVGAGLTYLTYQSGRSL